ncbi:MAG: polymerase, sigma-24 subunit, subfamily [Ilumatobacteraceae bacterium]|nr:polymerase, sigma-24 subunit, subfamily [Ilumatobacteraceae bacterium]
MTHSSDEMFAAERPRLVGLAYRLLGSLTDAEDVVQEAWVRWHRTDTSRLDSPQAWLTTVVSRLGIDRLRARQRDQSTYVGPWLPEPLVAVDDDPASAAELSDSLTTAFLVMLERLSANERLVLLLADVFQQPFSAVAEVVGKSEEATRQLAVRARRKVRVEQELRPSAAAPSRVDQLVVANEFVAALVAGDEARVRELLGADVVLISDGGANRHAARRPVVGPDRVGRFLLNIARRYLTMRGHEISASSRWVNGSPGIVISIDGAPYWVGAFEVHDGRVDRFFATLNPDKLGLVDREIELR